MTNTKKALLILGIFLLSGASQGAGERVIRATDLGPKIWSYLASEKEDDLLIEFRQGDEIPVSFEAHGDLIETRQTALNTVVVKKSFWLRLSQNTIEMSLDGRTFKTLSETLEGTLQLGTGSAQNGGVANAITILFKGSLKH